MRNTILFSTALAVALALCSCAKSESAFTRSGEKALITVSICGEQDTKATGVSAADEVALHDVQLFVFDASGAFESQAGGSSSVLSVGCTTGQKTVVALVNAPAVSPSSVSDLLGRVSALSDNSLSSFVMIGSVTPNVSGSASISIVVKRLVAKVSIGRITTSFTGVYASQPFVLKGIYLTNVAGDTTYGLAAPSSWYNKLAWSSSAVDALIADKGLSASIPNGGSHSTAHVFYPYPNPTTGDSNAGTWSPRHTKLVVEATLDGATWYYPIVLPVLQRNKTYTIENLTITRRGSVDPDEPIDKGTVSFNITVADWEVGLAPYSEVI